MDVQRLQSLLAQFPNIHLLVIGDYFLDLYLDLDRTLSEISLETELEAYQVVGVRSSPGAAGTVTSNLRALDVRVTALSVIGDDGRGYELLRGLRQRGVGVEYLIQVNDRFTPTYTKPLMREANGGIHELNRLDIKNRQPLSTEVEDAVIAGLWRLVPAVDGVIVADQVQERNCGVVSDRVRAALSELAHAHSEVVVAVDSRVRIGEYPHLVLKPNAREAVRAAFPEQSVETPDRATVEAAGCLLQARAARPVFVTVGVDGVLVFERQGMTHVPGVRVSGPLDIVGAGDSAMAGIVSALCCGASPAEAALIGNLVASITVQQIGTTGTATREQVYERFRELHRGT
jgi:rfaE bifunctional protein kinase chain/domain